MRYQGRLSDWNDDKGFGFVVPNGGGERAFVHIKAFAAPAPRPDNGALISYAVHRDEQGRLNASSVQLSGTAGGRQRRRSSGTTPSRPRIAFGLLALVLTGVLWLDDLIPDPLLLALAVLNLISFAAYWRDKNAARAQQWRVQESTLHLLALLGGWPGAAIAQGLFRHKTRKSSFQVVFWLSVLFNLAALSLFALGLEPAP